MPSTWLFVGGTLLLSLNFIRFAGLAVSDWFYFGAMLLAWIETARFERANLHCWTHNRFFWLAGLILFGAVISTSHALFLNAAIVEIFQQLYVITLFVSLLWVMVRRGKTELIVRAFIWSGVFTAAVAAVDTLAGTNFGPQLSGTPDIQFWGRYASTLGHPNKLGYFLVLTSILSLARLVELNLKPSPVLARWAAALLVGIQIFGVYLSGSLTAYLGFLLGLLALAAFSKTLVRRITRYSLAVVLLGGSLLLAGLVVMDVTLPDGFSLEHSLITTAVDRVENNTAYARWYIFEQALESIGEDPFVGAGYDQISTSGIGMFYRRLDGTVHNMFLQNWYVGGFFAFLGWVLIYLWLAWMAVKTLQAGHRKSVTPVLLGLAAATLAMMLMDQFQDAVYQREKWLVAGLLAAEYWTRLGAGRRQIAAPVPRILVRLPSG